jgi:small subunit ribosomal protein S6
LDTIIEKAEQKPSRKKKVKGAPKLYEAMFLVDSAEATADWDGVTTAIRNILEKEGAEIVSLRKWDDRKLAYAISGKSKGAYILCYFKAEGGKLRNIEKSIHLSERIIRALILCAEQRDIGQGEASGASRTADVRSSEKRERMEGERRTKEDEQVEAEDLEEER